MCGSLLIYLCRYWFTLIYHDLNLLMPGFTFVSVYQVAFIREYVFCCTPQHTKCGVRCKHPCCRPVGLTSGQLVEQSIHPPDAWSVRRLVEWSVSQKPGRPMGWQIARWAVWTISRSNGPSVRGDVSCNCQRRCFHLSAFVWIPPKNKKLLYAPTTCGPPGC